MSNFTQMAFSPATGLKNTDTFDTVPASEEAARTQIQSVIDQVKDHINNDLIAELENAMTGQCGAGRIGSQAISGVTGTTVFDQIDDLKTQIDAISTGSVADGTITTAKLANDAVTQDKLADDAAGEDQIADSAVTADKISAGAVSEAKLGSGAVTEAKIGTGAVTAAKIGTGAVTETKIGTGAVTETKIFDGAVTTAKLDDDAVTQAKIADDAVGAAQIADDAVGTAHLGTVTQITLGADDLLSYNAGGYLELVANGAAARKIPTVTYGTSSTPSGNTVAGSIYIKY